MEAGIRGARDASCLEPRVRFFSFGYYYADYVYGTTNDGDWGLRRDVSRAPATSKFNLLLYIF